MEMDLIQDIMIQQDIIMEIHMIQHIQVNVQVKNVEIIGELLDMFF